MGTTYTQVRSQCSRSRHRNGVSEQILIYGAVSIADVWYFFFFIIVNLFSKIKYLKKKRKNQFWCACFNLFKDIRYETLHGGRFQKPNKVH